MRIGIDLSLTGRRGAGAANPAPLVRWNFKSVGASLVSQIGACPLVSSRFNAASTYPYSIDDWEGAIRLLRADIVGLPGRRFVYNFAVSSAAPANASVQDYNSARVGDTFVVSYTVGGNSGNERITISLGASVTIIGTGLPIGTRVSSAPFTTSGASIRATFTGTCLDWQLENVTGQSNQNPSEYVSVGVLAAPYHGFGADGAKYFDYQNPCVRDSGTGIVTQGSYGTAFTTMRGLQMEETAAQLVKYPCDLNTAPWADIGTPTYSAAGARAGQVVLDLIGDDDAGVLEGKEQLLTTLTNTAVKGVSFFFKKGTVHSEGDAPSTVVFRDDTAGIVCLSATITWSGSTPTAVTNTGTQLRLVTLRDGSGNPTGVYRYEGMAATMQATTNSYYIRIYPAADAALTTTMTGNIYIGGVQVEMSSSQHPHVSPFIYQAGTVITRATDSVTRSSFSTYGFDAAEGTFVVQMRRGYLPQVGGIPDSGSYFFQMGSGTNARILTLVRTNLFVGEVSCLMRAGAGVEQNTGLYANAGDPWLDATVTGRCAHRYKLNDTACAWRGGAVAKDTSHPDGIPTTDGILCIAGNSGMQGDIELVEYHGPGITDAQVQQLSVVT